MDFRKDINALRAIAVILVVLFHFSLFGAEGGYIGVDVFFVISGFLMTAIICHKMPNDFSLIGFYAARFRRIFPALFVLCAVLLGLGWFFVAPADYEKLAQHAASSVGFFSNIVYKDEAGYFDTPSQFKWLLHTWSLSVEWQFYLLYPLLLSVLYKFLPQKVFGFLIGLTVLSLTASIYFSYTKPEFAFFYLVTRIWEMTAGGIVWFVAQKKINLPKVKARYVEALALSMIIAAAFIFSMDTMWPSFFALLPVVGTMLVLLYSAQSESKWIVSKPVQAIGLWSYSIYLWHWPIAVGLGYWTQDAPFWAKAIGIALSILLGFLSYRFIEQPCKNKFSQFDHKKVVIGAVVIIGAFIALGSFIKNQEGFPKRFENNERLQLAQSGVPAKKKSKHQCGFSRDTKKLTICPDVDMKDISYIVIGDSHAGSIYEAVAQAMPENAKGYLFSHQCATIFDAELKSKGRNNGCTEFYQQVVEYIEQTPDDTILIISNRYSASTEGPNERTNTKFGTVYNDDALNKMNPKEAYQQELVKSLCQLQDLRKTYAVKPIPEMGIDVPAMLSRRAIFNLPEQDVAYPVTTYNDRHETAIKALESAQDQCGLELIDPVPALCDQDLCYGSKDGMPYYRDDDHLNDAGRELLVPNLKEVLN
ncbi:MAG: acyltransferase family protein [Pseudomonadota bacterium]